MRRLAQEEILNFFYAKIRVNLYMYVWLVGWATQFAGFIFMRRNLERDKEIIGTMMDYYKRVDKKCHVSNSK